MGAEHREALLAAVDGELPLAPQELRLYCLALRRAGLSLSRIAAAAGSSKSSVARFCAAGFEGIDVPALASERLQRDRSVPAQFWNSDPKVLSQQVGFFDQQARRLGRRELPRGEPEVAEFIYESDASER